MTDSFMGVRTELFVAACQTDEVDNFFILDVNDDESSLGDGSVCDDVTRSSLSGTPLDQVFAYPGTMEETSFEELFESMRNSANTFAKGLSGLC